MKKRKLKKQDRWREDLNFVIGLSKDEKFMAAIRETGLTKPSLDAIIKACETLGLNPEDRRDLDICFGMLAYAIFKPKGGVLSQLTFSGLPGKPVQWTPDREAEFKRDRLTAMRIKPPTSNNDKIAKRLQDPKNASLLGLDYWDGQRPP